MKKRNVLLGVLLTTMLLTSTVFAKTTSPRVFVKGFLLEEQGIIRNNRVFVPMRGIAETLEFSVDYNPSDKRISIEKAKDNIVLYPGRNVANVNGKTSTLNAASFVEKGKTYVPVRFISEALNESVDWDSANKLALVGRPDQDEKMEDTEIYTNGDINYTLEVPTNWVNRVLIENENGKLYIYDKTTLNKFAEEGKKNVRPVAKVVSNKFPLNINLKNMDNMLLGRHNGKYIEAIFDKNMDSHKDTVDSYIRTKEEAKEILKSFKIKE